MVPSVVSGKSPSRTHTVGKPQRVTIQRLQDSLTKLESDTESATHHIEDDLDDDLADGRPPLKTPRMVGPASKVTVSHAIPKPHPAKLAKTSTLLTSPMGNLLAGLTEEATSEATNVKMEESIPQPVHKRRWGKKAAVKPSARTTQSKS
jgi:hypothetical protein